MNAIWHPTHPEKSNMARFMRFAEHVTSKKFPNYETLYNWSIEDSASFWQAIVTFFDIQFTTMPQEILSRDTPMMDTTWFNGATLNFAQHLLRRGNEHPAIISINEAGEREILSYQTLRLQVGRCATGLKKQGVKAGDRVAAVLPNVSFTVIAMLASASIGAIWSSCSPDFGANAIIDRLGQIEPKILFISDGHQYVGKIHDATDKISQIIAAIASLKCIVMCPVIGGSIKENTITWDEFCAEEGVLEFPPLPFSHPLYILFSSGTTGKPKCIVHSVGGTLLQHVKELGLHANINEDDNLFFYTTCGWMMWNWMVSVLALGATLTLYEGAPTYPDAYRLFDLLEKEKITVFGTSAKFLSSIEKEALLPSTKFNLQSLKTILSTGSPLLPQQYDFVYEHIKKNIQLSSISGGTDIVSCFALGNPILPVYRGELQCIGLGMAVQVFNEQGQAVYEERGELVCTKAFPSMPIGFWHDNDKKAYQHAYFSRFPTVWAHGDFAEITKHHGLIIYGRSDAVLNPGGVRIGTAEIYRQVEKISDILDSIVIGQDWQEDVRVVLFVKLRDGIRLDESLENLIRKTIRQNASPRHVPAKILQVPDIPRTISGKIVELAVRQVVHGQNVNNLESLANPEALTFFTGRKELTN